MMKKLFLVTAFMLSQFSVFAQGEVGSFNVQPKVGLNVSHFTGSDCKSPRFGLVAGLEWEYQFAERTSFSFGLLISMEGGKTGYGALLLDNMQNKDIVGLAEGDIFIKTNYLQVPIMTSFYPIKGLAIKWGFQVGVNLNSNYKLDAIATDGETFIGVKSDGKMSDLGIETKSFAFSIPVGLSYEYKNFVVEGRYNFDITRHFKYQPVWNNVFQFTVGMKIGR